ncbi:MAG: selenide, water dikinase SelD [Hyphomicrobiales bacterium]
MSSDEIKLTHYTHGLGCACKIRPQYLERVLKSVPIFPDPNVIVGNSHSDDASVFKIDNNTAIVQSLDFFTPIVDDPYEFGQIAAANALSDIYAMGAQPLFAQNIVGFPDHRLPMDVLTQILKGASDKASEAGISILGGHTVEDTEPKFGMVVSGKIHPDKILSNDKAKDNHVLILTKPLGLGILSTAVKRGIVDNDKAKEISQIMATLNKRAAEIMVNYDISTCTDITGFGLLGHLYEITSASELGAEIYLSKVPFISGAYDCAISGIIPGGSKNNLKHIEDKVDFSNEISNVHRLLLCDAQTSGGLLIAVSSNDKEKLLSELLDNGMNASIIGSLTKGKGKISILK